MIDCPRSRWITRLAASMVAASLLTTPTLVQAAPKLASQTKQIPKASKNGFSAGKKAFDGGDYARAGDEWAAVLTGLNESAQTQGPRMRLVLDTIASYREAYAGDGNIAHLEAAMDTYYAYFKAYKNAYGTPSIPRPVVEARHELKNELDEAKKDGGGAAAAGGGSGSNDSGSGGSGSNDDGTTGSNGGGNSEGDSDSDNSTNSTDSTNDSSTTQSAEDPSASSGGSDAGGSNAGTSVSVSTQPGNADKAGTPLIAAGAAIMAVGVGASSLIVVGAVEGKRARADHKLPGYTDEQRAAIDKRGKSMNALFIAGLAATPALVGAGVALIIVGSKKRKQAAMQASIAPLFKRGVAGVSVSGKF